MDALKSAIFPFPIGNTLLGKTWSNNQKYHFNGTHMEELMLYWIQYKNLLKYKFGCFWRFSYVYTVI